MTRTHYVNDHLIQAAVIKRFDWSPVVQTEHVGVAVTDGAVTLAGEVETEFERESAIHEATQVKGVSAVVDEIVVRDPTRPANDADIARAVQAMLQNHRQLRDLHLTASVSDKIVTLSGIVDTTDQRRAAYRAAASQPRVVAVRNELVVRAFPSADDLAAKIEEAFKRSVELEVEKLRVEVDGHEVTLQGTVHSWYERRAAERAAHSVDGVTSVNNELAITS